MFSEQNIANIDQKFENTWGEREAYCIPHPRSRLINKFGIVEHLHKTLFV